MKPQRSIQMQSEEHGVSALVCTCNRGDAVTATIQSILRPDTLCQELIVVDQSTNMDTERAIRPFLTDGRLRYIHIMSSGKGAALNQGLEMARGTIVAITDDDCTVSPAWPLYHVEAMRTFPRVAMSYGQVVAEEYDSSLGYIPAYSIPFDRIFRSPNDRVAARGIGANTAVRRDVILALGGFDSHLGPGGRFHAAIDRDMTLRCLLAGYHIYESAQSVVLHSGFRTWEQGKKHSYRAWYGMGASYAKPIRAGKWSVALSCLQEYAGHAVGPFVVAAVSGKERPGWQRMRGFIDGFYAGWRTQIDPKTLVYLPVAAVDLPIERALINLERKSA